jgi:hypothetical protein
MSAILKSVDEKCNLIIERSQLGDALNMLVSELAGAFSPRFWTLETLKLLVQWDQENGSPIRKELDRELARERVDNANGVPEGQIILDTRSRESMSV